MKMCLFGRRQSKHLCESASAADSYSYSYSYPCSTFHINIIPAANFCLRILHVFVVAFLFLGSLYWFSCSTWIWQHFADVIGGRVVEIIVVSTGKCLLLWISLWRSLIIWQNSPRLIQNQKWIRCFSNGSFVFPAPNESCVPKSSANWKTSTPFSSMCCWYGL